MLLDIQVEMQNKQLDVLIWSSIWSSGWRDKSGSFNHTDGIESDETG